MAESGPHFRVFATCDIGKEALDLLRQRGYEVEVYDRPEAPPKSLIVEKVRSGIDGLITTLRDSIDAEIFEAGRTVRGLIDVLERTYGDNPAAAPYVVNKEAFR